MPTAQNAVAAQEAWRRSLRACDGVTVADPSSSESDDEAHRLAVLDSYEILDTPPEQGFEDIVQLACRICETPVALVSLVAAGRQWFKARVGFGPHQTPLSQSVCAVAIQQPGLLVISDLSTDARTRENTLVTADPAIRFYAGARLETPEGVALGSLCVIDSKPRPEGLSPAQASSLEALARQVMALLVLRRTLARRHAADERRSFLLRLTDLLRAQGDPRGRVQAAVDALGCRLGAHRVGFAMIEGGGGMRLLGTEYVDGLEPLAAADPVRAFGPGNLADLKAGRTSARADAASGSDAAVPVPGGAVAQLVVPQMHEGGLRAVLYLHQRTVRHWTPDEVSLVEDVAGRIWDAVERVRAEGDLRALNASLEARVAEQMRARSRTWQVSPDLLGVVNTEGYFEASNPAWHAVLGYSPAEVASTVFFDFLHPDDLAENQAAWRAALKGQPAIRLENRYRHKDGSYRWLSWVAVPEGEKVYCSARDITAEKAQAMELAARTAERNRLWETTHDLMGTAGLDGYMKNINPAWTRMLGWSEAEVLGRPFTAIIDPADHAETVQVIRKLAAGEIVDGFVDRIRSRDGTWRTVMWTAVPEPGGQVFYVVGRDLTQQRETEEALRQSQKLEAVGLLTGGVAHDFNNLLTVIKSSTDLLKRPNLPEERRVRYVAAISDTVDRAAKLTSQLLAFARRQALQPEVFDTGRSVRAIGEMLGTLLGGRIEVDIRLPDTACYIDADASQFDTALVNMAVNARDAMDGEGRLTVTVEPVDEMPAMRSKAPLVGDFVAVALTDTGAGIPAEQQDRIFEPFFTTKDVGQGTGLGLSQVFGFAKQSGGEVTVRSVLGQGTTFTLYLPRAARQAVAGVDAVAHEPVEDGLGTRVLVVEDNRDVGHFATQTLQELGYRTHLVAGADAALSELAARPGAHDIVFSDVMMPGMNGIDLGREIARLYPGLPLVLTSGYSQVLAQDGAHGFVLLHKPYSVETLSRALRAAVGRRRTGPPPASLYRDRPEKTGLAF